MNLGGGLLGMGQYGKAVECYKKALEINPDFVEAYSNLIFAQDFMTVLDCRTHLHARRDWAENYVDHLMPGEPQNDNDPDPDRKLRIGYIGGDFKEHSAARVWGGMVIDYDRSQFEVYCYNNNTTKGDAYTARFKEAATQWRDVGATRYPEVVELMHKASEECYNTWVEVLKAVPNSRFLLKAGELADEASRAATLWNFTKSGINPERIRMLGATKWPQHVGAYNLVDMALDPFPHGG